MVLESFDQETVELVPENIIMKSSQELTQYFIQSWSLEYRSSSKYHSGLFLHSEAGM